MVDTHRMAELLHLCEAHGSSLRLVGDPAQLSAIGAGGMLPRLLDIDAVAVAELSEIHRTPHAWLRDFQNHVRDGRSAEALAILREHSAAHMLDTQAEAMQRMVDDWNGWRHKYEPGDTLLVVHTTNADVDTVNTLAQAKRLNAGELGLHSVKSPDRDYNLREGDRVMLREAAYRFDDPSERRVENGTRGTIENVDIEHNRVVVRLDEPGHEPRTVEIELERCEGLRLDYASHVYPAQGDTRSRTAELTGGAAVSRESAYVGGSRLREHHDLYTSRELLGTAGTDAERWQRLADQMNQSRAQVPAIDYHEQPGRHIATHVPGLEHVSSPGRLVEVERELMRATALHDELRATYPFELKREMDQVKGEWKRTRSSYEHAESSIAQAERDLEQLKPWQREQQRETRRQLAEHVERRDRLVEQDNELVAKYNELSARPDAPKVWREQHGPELVAREQRMSDLSRERDQVRAQAIEHHVRNPQTHLTRVLGERPASGRQGEVWDRAARAIETYRHNYNVTDRTTALGREPEGDHQRWLAFDKTREEAVNARDRLGRSNQQHTAGRVMGLAIDLPGGRNRGTGRER